MDCLMLFTSLSFSTAVRTRADAEEPISASLYCADSILQHDLETLLVTEISRWL